jgi:malate dehydrogenase
VLDSSRLRSFIAMELGVSMEDVQATVLGGHGDTMVPLPRFCTVAGIPIPELLAADKIEAMVARTKGAGGEIVKLLKTGSAFYSTASAVTEMVESILKDKKRVLPVAAKLDGEYGVKGVFLGVPVKLGAGGIEQVIELKLTDEEAALLKQSAEHVEKTTKDLK